MCKETRRSPTTMIYLGTEKATHKGVDGRLNRRTLLRWQLLLGRKRFRLQGNRQCFRRREPTAEENAFRLCRLCAYPGITPGIKQGLLLIKETFPSFTLGETFEFTYLDTASIFLSRSPSTLLAIAGGSLLLMASTTAWTAACACPGLRALFFGIVTRSNEFLHSALVLRKDWLLV